MIAAAAYYFGDGTQRQIAASFGITQSALSQRITGFLGSLSAQQRERFLRRAHNRRGAGRKRIVHAIQLSLVENV